MALSKSLNPNAASFEPENRSSFINDQDCCYSLPPNYVYSNSDSFEHTNPSPFINDQCYSLPPNYVYSNSYLPNMLVNYNQIFFYQCPTVQCLSLVPSSLTDKLLKNPSAELSKLHFEVNEVSEENKKKKKFGARVIDAKGRNRRLGGELTKSKSVVSSKQRPEKDIGNGSIIPFPTELNELEATGKTTIMIRNIPNQFSRRDLLRILNQHCRLENHNLCAAEKSIKSGYDFIYLPMDFNKFWREKRIANLGYAFVNFISPIAAWRFYKSFDKLNWQVAVNNKICEVTLAVTQGRVGLEERFRTKLFYCHTDEYLPLAISPVCYGVESYRHGRNIGRRVHTFPRRGIVKSKSKPALCS